MMKSAHLLFPIAAVAVSLVCFANLGFGGELDPDEAVHDWQVRRLIEPTPQELEKERKGSVYIYDGLTDREVNAALNTQFPRIENMMFVGTKKTDKSGKPLRDPDSGQPVQESHGCD
jgi:hypothetical protein